LFNSQPDRSTVEEPRLNSSTHDRFDSPNGVGGVSWRRSDMSTPKTTSVLPGWFWWTSTARTLVPLTSVPAGIGTAKGPV
jgi:hypothetical protein